MPRGLGLVLGGLIAVGAVATAVYRLWPRPESDESARVRALEARVAWLESQRLRSSSPRPAPAGEPHLLMPVGPGTPPGPAEAATPWKPARPASGAPADEVALQREYFGDLDVRLASEARDPVWAAATEAKLRSSAHDLRPRITVENAQCGQTMCRVEAAVPDPADDRAAMDRFLDASMSVLPEAVIRDGETPGRHIVYFVRQGSELPPMTPSEPAQ